MKLKSLTPFGIEVKKKLLELRMTQKEFCKKHNIPEPRFSEILYGIRPGRRYKKKRRKFLILNFSALSN